MQLTFLEAEVPLTKAYEKKLDGSYVGGAYPGVTNFTSHVEQISGPQEFCDALKKHAEPGHCLLTNSLARPIVKESRRKLSDKEEPRQWILLDVDGIEGIVSAEDFIAKCLPQQFQQTSYILQHSPSSGIKPGVRAHLFFMLEDSVDVTSVSAWLKFANLETQSLSDQITLSKNSMALSLKLDWVANNNGRIVYITPPECTNFDDPVTERISLVTKKYDRLSFNFAAIGSSQMRAKYRDKLGELRGLAGLPVSRKAEYYIDKGHYEIVADALVEPARVTSYEADNERFMRCNLDGGDSFAYYYHRHNPVYLHNFKGEPSVKLKLLDPEFYDRVAKPDYEAIQATQDRPFVFRDAPTDKYYVGIRNGDQIIEQPHVVGSRDKIEDYFVLKGQTSPPANIETWFKIFDPTKISQWVEDDATFNTWRPTEYQLNPMKRTSVPPVIDKVLKSVTGSDQETYDHFMNWMAYIFQNRTKTGTAWVLHGVPGTGKGLLFSKILRPLFGYDYTAQKQIGDLVDRFNGWMEQCIIVNVDEANSADAGYEGKNIVSRLKNWITEPTMSIRHMQATARDMRSFINFIFTTNDFGILPIQDGDRRFNVAPRQLKKLEITTEEVDAIDGELMHFAGYLAQYKVNKAAAHTPLDNTAKTELKIAAESSIDSFFRALQEGDLEYFIEGMDEDSREYESLNQYKMSVQRWMDDLKKYPDEPVIVYPDEARHAHIVLCRDKGMKAGQFKSMCAKRGFPIQRLRDGERRITGWRIAWNLSDEAKVQNKMHLTPVPTTEELEAKVRAEVNGDKDA